MSVAAILNICVLHIARLSQAFSCGCLLMRLNLFSLLLVWARRSLVATYWIFVFIFACLSQAFSCGVLFQIARFEPGFSCGLLLNLFSLLLVWARRSLVWNLFSLLLVWARRSLVALFEYLYFILLVWARRSLVATYLIFVFHIASLSQAFSCGRLLNLFSLLLVWARRSLVAVYWLFVYFILLVWARRSLVAIYWIFVFLIAHLSQAASFGILIIFVFVRGIRLVASVVVPTGERDFTLVSSLPCDVFYILSVTLFWMILNS